MTIEEVENLRKQELKNQLRFPKLQIDLDEVEKTFSIQSCVYYMVNDKMFLSKLLNKIFLKKMGFKVSGKGTKDMPYVIESEFGKGKCFNIKHIFKGGKCPFEVGNCFSNAFNMAGEMINLQNVINCDCVSGLALVKNDGKNRTILHSVVELNEWVIDVNLGLVISKDLYYKLFMFEELSRIDGAKVEDMLELLKKDATKDISSTYNLRTYHMVFALEDMVDFIKNETRRNGHDVFQELNH